MSAAVESERYKRQPSFSELFTPKLVTVLREGYGLKQLHADAIAGLTVAIVALPLSMAIAIASGVSPDRGLYAAIVGGFIVSALGGSRFQIGGPAGAFIVLVCVDRGPPRRRRTDPCHHDVGGFCWRSASAGSARTSSSFPTR